MKWLPNVKFTALLRHDSRELCSPASEFDEMILVDDRLELCVLAGVGLLVEDGLRGVGVDLGTALVLGARSDHASGFLPRHELLPLLVHVAHHLQGEVLLLGASVERELVWGLA